MGLHETWVRNCRFRSYYAFSVLPFNFTLQTLENYLSRLGNGTITQSKTLWLCWRKINVEYISNFRYWTVAEADSWGGAVRRELFAGSLCRRWQPDLVNMNIWSCSWHLLCVRLTFGPSIPSRAPPNTAVLLCPSSALPRQRPRFGSRHHLHGSILPYVAAAAPPVLWRFAAFMPCNATVWSNHLPPGCS